MLARNKAAENYTVGNISTKKLQYRTPIPFPCAVAHTVTSYFWGVTITIHWRSITSTNRAMSTLSPEIFPLFLDICFTLIRYAISPYGRFLNSHEGKMQCDWAWIRVVSGEWCSGKCLECRYVIEISVGHRDGKADSDSLISRQKLPYVSTNRC